MKYSIKKLWNDQCFCRLNWDFYKVLKCLNGNVWKSIVSTLRICSLPIRQLFQSQDPDRNPGRIYYVNQHYITPFNAESLNTNKTQVTGQWLEGSPKWVGPTRPSEHLNASHTKICIRVSWVSPRLVFFSVLLGPLAWEKSQILQDFWTERPADDGNFGNPWSCLSPKGNVFYFLSSFENQVHTWEITISRRLPTATFLCLHAKPMMLDFFQLTFHVFCYCYPSHSDIDHISMNERLIAYEGRGQTYTLECE